MVEVLKIMVTSFKRSHALTATLSAPNPAAGHHRPTPTPETPGHSRANPGQSLVGSLLLSLRSLCTQGSVCALPESVSPVLCKFWQLYGELMATSSQRAYVIPRSTTPRAPAPAAVHSWSFALSLCEVSVSCCVQGMFEPSEHLWRVWDLILHVISFLLPSCWGFLFALACGVSPQSHSSSVQLLVQHLLSCWGFSALGHGVSLPSHSSTMQLLFQCRTAE